LPMSGLNPPQLPPPEPPPEEPPPVGPPRLPPMSWPNLRLKSRQISSKSGGPELGLAGCLGGDSLSGLVSESGGRGGLAPGSEVGEAPCCGDPWESGALPQRPSLRLNIPNRRLAHPKPMGFSRLRFMRDQHFSPKDAHCAQYPKPLFDLGRRKRKQAWGWRARHQRSHGLGDWLALRAM
jgi:hypothetical protein